ncbi:glutathione hydrolase 5 proenzyme isoform X2 [Sceloporus undulatus]|uniref:glutathione hydrolase 5 proenzyme isoform X2 n=1 Tax=Sceloporus undulatus TaxID=8520 RepID=UPI001C4AACEE|nr:glutathione hydrolase 5 proenzyme isoform X2 [Sceloporus undulatus]
MAGERTHLRGSRQLSVRRRIAQRDVLKSGGSAVDAAIAALVCTSVLNPQSMGLAGGVILTVYNATTGKVEVINARERAPQNIPENLLDQCREGLMLGPKWIAVPGELRGYETAHRRHGKLPWKALFEPTIAVLRHGVRIPEVLGRFLKHPLLQRALEQSSLRKLFSDVKGNLLGTGDLLHWTALEETLRAVAENGADEFYAGKTAEKLAQDVSGEGGNLTLEDLHGYRVSVKSATKSEIGDYDIYSAPRPAAGPILFFILNVLKGFNFTKDSVSTIERKAEAYHYIAEALKFANGQKAKVDDPDFSKNGEDVINHLVSDSFAATIWRRIDSRGDHSAAHYEIAQARWSPYGTSHVAVLAQDGSAVSATSTINQPFGSMVYSQQTGLILNNEMADFCMKRSDRKVYPGEMPPSSMTPSILISRDGASKLVIGGSGGTLITPAVALAIVNKLWFGYDLEGAIQAPILYATKTGSLEVEPNFDQEIMAALHRRGHAIKTAAYPLNVVQGVAKDGPCVFPYSDQRKNGKASGY